MALQSTAVFIVCLALFAIAQAGVIEFTDDTLAEGVKDGVVFVKL